MANTSRTRNLRKKEIKSLTNASLVKNLCIQFHKETKSSTEQCRLIIEEMIERGMVVEKEMHNLFKSLYEDWKYAKYNHTVK